MKNAENLMLQFLKIHSSNIMCSDFGYCKLQPHHSSIQKITLEHYFVVFSRVLYCIMMFFNGYLFHNGDLGVIDVNTTITHTWVVVGDTIYKKSNFSNDE